ncbi:tetratricopeptide repeat protein, partial [candidate division WOR-3 bacterium]|nr:tetratricopeptide repeat protein [candidate division WOR-3 bacterium]
EEALEIALNTFGEVDSLVAYSLHNIGAIYYSRHVGRDYDKALEMNQKALDIRLKVLGEYHPDVVKSYNNIAHIYAKLNDYQKSLELHKKALEIEEKLYGPEHLDVAETYNAIGNLYLDGLRFLPQAIENYEKVIEIKGKVLGPDHPDIADIYVKIGEVCEEVGFYQKAIESYDKALNIRLKAFGENDPKVAEVYLGRGYAYGETGSYEEAQEDFKKALIIRLEAFGEESEETASANQSLGWIYCILKNYQKARNNYQKALDIGLKVLEPDSYRLGLIYNGMGKVDGNIGSYKEAIENYETALELFEKKLGAEHHWTAMSYHGLGDVYGKKGSFKKALEYYQKALGIFMKSMGSAHPYTAVACSDIGRLYRDEDELDSALVYFEKSIEGFEKSRNRISSRELQENYTESLRERYDDIINLLFETGRTVEAFDYAERYKTKSVKDIVDGTYYLDMGDEVLGEKARQARLLATKTGILENQLEEEELYALRDDTKIENISNMLADTKAEYLKIAAEVRTDPDYSFSVEVHPTDIITLGQALKDNQKMVMFYPGYYKLYTFVVSNKGHKIYSVDVCSDSLNTLLYDCLRMCDYYYIKSRYEKYGEKVTSGWSWQDDGSDFYNKEVKPLKQGLLRLYKYLIEPIEEELSSVDVVTIIPSGELFYVPWAALMDTEGTFFTERFKWHIMTSAELYKCVQRRDEQTFPLETFALVGNPAGDLKTAEAMVKSIHKIYPNSSVLLGKDASEPNVTREAADKNVLHLATHCALNPANPMETFIMLAPTDSTDSMWTVAEVWGQSWKNMRLVTLAACESAVGGLMEGLDFITMAKAFSFAMEGPPSIIATLWIVAGRSTDEFMVGFYNNLKKGDGSAKAMIKSQQELIHSNKYSHPYFWAPFVLIGEWR